MNLEPGYYYFRFPNENACVRFWDGEVWRFAQEGQETDFQLTHTVEKRFLAKPIEYPKHTYYGDPQDSQILEHRWPHKGDELCDGHQIHYEWDGRKWT